MTRKRVLKTPHYLFLDIDLFGVNSINDIPRIQHLYPDIEILMYTDSSDYKLLLSSFYAGAKGYLIKNRSTKDLLTQIQILRQGGAVLSPFLARELIVNIEENHRSLAMSGLTDKDIETIQLLSEGWTYVKVADKLGITMDAVRGRVKRIYSKLNVNNKGDAIRLFKKWNLG